MKETMGKGFLMFEKEKNNLGGDEWFRVRAVALSVISR